MHAWLQSLMPPEDPLVWTWLFLVLGYALVGVVLGRRARQSAAAPAGPDSSSSTPSGSSSR